MLVILPLQKLSWQISDSSVDLSMTYSLQMSSKSLDTISLKLLTSALSLRFLSFMTTWLLSEEMTDSASLLLDLTLLPPYPEYQSQPRELTSR